jgi:hypothetical protein
MPGCEAVDTRWCSLPTLLLNSCRARSSASWRGGGGALCGCRGPRQCIAQHTHASGSPPIRTCVGRGYLSLEEQRALRFHVELLADGCVVVFELRKEGFPSIVVVDVLAAVVASPPPLNDGGFGIEVGPARRQTSGPCCCLGRSRQTTAEADSTPPDNPTHWHRQQQAWLRCHQLRSKHVPTGGTVRLGEPYLRSVRRYASSASRARKRPKYPRQ